MLPLKRCSSASSTILRTHGRGSFFPQRERFGKKIRFFGFVNVPLDTVFLMMENVGVVFVGKDSPDTA